MTSKRLRSALSPLSLLLSLLLVFCTTASAAPQAYVITGTWDTIGVPIGAAKGNIFEAVWLYDPTPYDETTNPTGALDYTDIAETNGDLDWPGYQRFYRIPSPSIGMPELIPNAGPGGINYLDVNLADPNNVDLPRSKVNGKAEPTDPALIKVAKDIPDLFDGDVIEMIDHIDMTGIGLGPVNRWNIFFFNVDVLTSLDLPTDLDGDVFNPINPWGGGVASNFAYTTASTSLEQIPLGDATRDSTVDGADYTVWADNYLQTGKLWKHGDFNIDGIVDGADYTVWADHYLETIPFNPPAWAAAVPEPRSLVLAMLGGALLAGSRVGLRRSRTGPRSASSSTRSRSADFAEHADLRPEVYWLAETQVEGGIPELAPGTDVPGSGRTVRLALAQHALPSPRRESGEPNRRRAQHQDWHFELAAF